MEPLPIHFFGTRQDVLVAVAAGRGLQRHGVGAVLRLGEPEGADLLHPRHRRQPPLALLLGAEHRDRLHREEAVHAVEGADAAVGARPLGGHQAGRDRAHAGGAVALDRAAGDAELGDLGHELEGELRPLPEVVDPRGDLRVAEGAHPVADLDLLGLEEVLEGVEVRRHRLGHDSDATTARGMLPDVRVVIAPDSFSGTLPAPSSRVPVGQAEVSRPRA